MKKIKSIVLPVIVGVILFSGILYSVFRHSNTPVVEGRERKMIYNAIKELLESRSGIMVSDRTILHENHFISQHANAVEERQRNQIVQFRDKMRESGETYSSVRTDIQIIDSEKRSDSVLSVKIQEETNLTIAETKTETGYEAQHEFILRKEGRVWKLVEDRQLDPIGLLPLKEAEKYVYKKDGRKETVDR